MDTLERAVRAGPVVSDSCFVVASYADRGVILHESGADVGGIDLACQDDGEAVGSFLPRRMGMPSTPPGGGLSYLLVAV